VIHRRAVLGVALLAAGCGATVQIPSSVAIPICGDPLREVTRFRPVDSRSIPGGTAGVFEFAGVTSLGQSCSGRAAVSGHAWVVADTRRPPPPGIAYVVGQRVSGTVSSEHPARFVVSMKPWETATFVVFGAGLHVRLDGQEVAEREHAQSVVVVSPIAAAYILEVTPGQGQQGPEFTLLSYPASASPATSQERP
jgi:hypothetical protein